MKQIRLIAKDFDHLGSSEKTEDQYCNSSNCPIAKAMMRQGMTFNHRNKGVDPFTIDSDQGDRIKIHGSDKEVERCRKALASGAKYAVIRVLS